MGTFQGHLLPGSIFVVFGLWWTTQITKRHFLCQKGRIAYYSSATYPCLAGRCLTYPLEGIIKVTVTATGMALELFASTDYGRSSSIVFWGDIQHVTMYFFFFLSGVVDIIQHKKKHLLPPNLDKLTMALAFAAEGILFKFHLHGRSDLDVMVHTLLVYAITGCVISTLVEIQFDKHVLVSFSKAYCMLLQGTWFIQVGMILYPPIPRLKHWSSDHEDMMLATMLFAWHMGSVFVVMGFIAVLTRCLNLTCCPAYHGTTELQMVTTQNPHKEDFSYHQLQDYDEADESFQPLMVDAENDNDENVIFEQNGLDLHAIASNMDRSKPSNRLNPINLHGTQDTNQPLLANVDINSNDEPL